MLKQRGVFILELSDGSKVPLRFCTWTLMRFCEVNGDIDMNQMTTLIGDGGMTLKQFISLIQCAAEYTPFKEGKTPDFRPIDVSDWIDDIGGMQSPGFAAISETIRQSFSDGDTNGQEKKRVAKV